jgi:hypothetical protein
LQAATVNRVCTGLLASLNLAVALKASLAPLKPAWTIGLQAIAGADQSRNVILPEPKVRLWVELAATEGPEFALLFELAAVTGTRYDQLARLLVRDLQDKRVDPRLMVPTSRKGRGDKKITHRPVGIPTSLASRLRAVVNGRPMTDQLLRKSDGTAWAHADQSRPTQRVVELAGLDPKVVTFNALRHSHIVRQLLAGKPPRVIAVAHDTSVAMLEKTYSAHIDDFADAMMRDTLLDMSEPASPLTIVRERQ